MATKKKAAPKRGASRYQAPAKRPVPGWIWLACGLAIGVFVMLLMKLEPGRDDIRREKPENAQRSLGKPSDKPAATTPSTATPTPQPAKPKYDFYTLLPESEVIVPPDAVPEQTPPPPTPQELAKADAARAEAALKGETPPPLPTAVKAASTQFFLQAGSFRKQADAEKVRAQIAMLGQGVQLESGTVREETWYRVLVGPFSNREQLTQAQKQLAGSGYGNLLLQQRQVR
ncbi:SPOR domain-containing protein [Pseudomonas sp. UL073]|uniref:SPOR domain-containing protein n=1 Tax=Zestomonas insulae TaxID=2809017 RepID=A0ABS2IDL7_9GAMM|nr:SPOR domain-containing protein [Pseudomonas insulae]MBM7061135.1 SPOR domain-containing protein [Pseudomonas insulae]